MKPRGGRGRERQGPGAGLAPGEPPLKKAQGRTRQHKGDDPVLMGEMKMPPSQHPLFPKPSLPPGGGAGALRMGEPGRRRPGREILPDPGDRDSPEPGATRQPRAASGHAPISRTRTKISGAVICGLKSVTSLNTQRAASH